jgi:hypothetical protein
MAFAYVERILNAPDLALAVATSLSTIEGRLADLSAAGFEQLVVSPMHTMAYLDEVAECVADNSTRTFTKRFAILFLISLSLIVGERHSLLRPFFRPSKTPKASYIYIRGVPVHSSDANPCVTKVSNSIVVFLRLLTSAYIRLNADDFVPFLFDPETTEPVGVRQFCESQVEATGREAGMSLRTQCAPVSNHNLFWMDYRRSPTGSSALSRPESLHRCCLCRRKCCRFSCFRQYRDRGFRAIRHGGRKGEWDCSYYATVPVS